MFHDLIKFPDLRPSHAHPDHRAQRKAIEQEHPYFDIKELGLKAAVLALVAGIACYPKIKAEADIVERAQELRRAKDGRDRKWERDRRRRAENEGLSRSENGRRRSDGDRMRNRERRRRDEGSSRTSGSDRTRDWIESGHEYPNRYGGHRERDRRRW